MDYCLPSQQIPSYAPSSGGSSTDTLTTKNIDCVSLEADTIKCAVLEINGAAVDQTDVNLLMEKTQNQTGVPNVTTFLGDVEADTVTCTSLSTNTIVPQTTAAITCTALTCNGDITCKSLLQVDNTSVTTTETALLSAYDSTLAAGSQTYIRFGKDTSNCGLLTYYGDNSVGLNLSGYAGPLITTTGFNIPNSLYVGTNEVVPRTIGTFTYITAGTTGREYKFSFVGKTNIRRVVISVMGWRKAAASTIPYLQFSSDNSVYYSNNASAYNGATTGNHGGTSLPWRGTTSGSQIAGIPLFNTVTIPASSAGTFNFVTVVELTYMGLYTGSQEQWNVSGSFSSTTTGGTGGTGPYYGSITGYLQCTEALYPTIRAIKMIAQDDFIAEGNINITYY